MVRRCTYTSDMCLLVLFLFLSAVRTKNTEGQGDRVGRLPCIFASRSRSVLLKNCCCCCRYPRPAQIGPVVENRPLHLPTLQKKLGANWPFVDLDAKVGCGCAWDHALFAALGCMYACTVACVSRLLLLHRQSYVSICSFVWFLGCYCVLFVPFSFHICHRFILFFVCKSVLPFPIFEILFGSAFLFGF